MVSIVIAAGAVMVPVAVILLLLRGSGTASISAGFGEYFQNCSVTVTEPGIILSKTVSTLYLGDSATVETEVIPKGTTVKWSSEDNSSATVNDEGNFVA